MKYYIGIDVGTTGTKSMLIDESGSIIHTAYEGYEVVSEKPDYVEQNPDDWYKAVKHTVKSCSDCINDKSEIMALSVSAQGGTVVITDKNNKPLRPAISWLDKRAFEETEELDATKPDNYYYLKTGWRLERGYNLAEIKWISKHEPEVFKNAAKFLSTLDYINLKISGQAMTDYTNQAITNLEDINTKDWDESIFKDIGISREQLPDLKPAGTVIGKITKAASEEMGLSPNTILVNGGYDQYCATYGLGAVKPGDVMLSTGTAWVAIAVTDKLIFDTKSYISPGLHIIPNLYGIMASLETGGISLEWFKNKITSDESYKNIDVKAGEKNEGANGLIFYPHFSGSTCPTWSSKSKGTFLGLTLYHDRYDMARAIMEGVIFEINRIFEVLRSKGIEMKSIKLVGGASKSDLWTQLIADITQIPVERYSNADAAAIGACMIAAVGDGAFDSFEGACKSFKQESLMVYPNADKKEVYLKIYSQYKKGFDYLRNFYTDGNDA